MPGSLTAFTVKHNGIANVLKTQIDVSPLDVGSSVSVMAIWDTGASGTVITSKVVTQLGLTPTGAINVSTANGDAVQNTYLVRITLPNNVMIDTVVTECPKLSGGSDALIGMNIIGLGDFSVTNYQGNTCMSFRYPSSHEIDYVKRLNHGIKQKHPPGTQGSNITPPKKKRRR